MVCEQLKKDWVENGGWPGNQKIWSEGWAACYKSLTAFLTKIVNRESIATEEDLVRVLEEYKNG